MGRLGLHLRNIKFEDLDKSSQDRILAVEEAKCQAQIDAEESVLQEIWIKLSVLILSDMHFSEETVMEYVGSFKGKYRAAKKKAIVETPTGKFQSTPAMLQWINEQIKERFPDFPQSFLDSLKGN